MSLVTLKLNGFAKLPERQDDLQDPQAANKLWSANVCLRSEPIEMSNVKALIECRSTRLRL